MEIALLQFDVHTQMLETQGMVGTPYSMACILHRATIAKRHCAESHAESISCSGKGA